MKRTTLAATICCLLVAALSLVGYTDPDTSTVTAFRALVADYSVTSGGYSPAISPDGRTLAYITTEGDVWILHANDLGGETEIEPWRLLFRSLPNGQLSPNTFDLGHSRNVDWSPDGKSLAFGYLDGRLYVADGFDFDARTASVHAVVSKRNVDQARNCAYALGSPRWSPDGKRIALVREREGHRALVEIVDAESGKTTVLSMDAIPSGAVWGEPWTADGKYLAYGSCKAGSDRHSIVVTSADGAHKTRLESDLDPCPSWSPSLKKLAFKSQKETLLNLSTDLGLVAFYSAIGVTEGVYAGAKTVSKPVLQSAGQTAAAKQEALGRLRSAILQKYGADLTTADRQSLKRAPMSAQQMSDLVCRLSAKKAGKRCQVIVERLAVKRGSGSLAKAVMSSKDISEADRQAFVSGISRLLAQIMPAGWYSKFEFDSSPVWSPDGKKIAFIRTSHQRDRQQLMVLDLATGRERSVFTSGEIQCVSWLRNSLGLILQSQRLMTLRPSKTNGTAEIRKVSTPGYPEIWLLQIEQPSNVAQKPSRQKKK